MQRQDIGAALAEIARQEAEDAKKRKEREQLKKNLLEQQQKILQQVGAINQPAKPPKMQRWAYSDSDIHSDSDKADEQIPAPVSTPDPDINYVADDGEAPYEWNYGAPDNDPYDDAKLREASFKGDLKTINDLLDKGARIEAYDKADYHYQGRVPIRFHEYSPHSNERGNPFEGDAFHNAIRGDQPEALRLLINRLAKLMLRKLKAYNEAGCYGKKQFGYLTAQALAPHIAGVTPFFRNLLWQLRTDERIQLIQRMIPEIDIMFQRSNSLLIEAILARSEKCIDMLLNDFSKRIYSRLIYIAPGPSSHQLERYQDGHTLFVSPAYNGEYSVYAKCYNLSREEGVKFNKESLSAVIEPLAQKVKLIDSYGDLRWFEGYKVAISYDHTIIDQVAQVCEGDHGNCDDLMNYREYCGDVGYSSNGNALSLAVSLGDIHLAERLIAAGCSLEASYSEKNPKKTQYLDEMTTYKYYCDTPLMQAIINDDTAMAKLLLEKGANIKVFQRTCGGDENVFSKATSSDMRALLRDHLTLTDRLAMQNIVLPKQYLSSLSNRALLNIPMHYMRSEVDGKQLDDIKAYVRTEEERLDQASRSTNTTMKRR